MSKWDEFRDHLVSKCETHYNEIVGELTLRQSETIQTLKVKHHFNECHGCDLYTDDGHCRKFRKNGKCEPSTKDWLTPSPYDDPPEFIPVNRMCRKASIFGNDYIGLTQDDIDRLKNGEVVHISGEYGIFIGFVEKEKENEQRN